MSAIEYANTLVGTKETSMVTNKFGLANGVTAAGGIVWTRYGVVGPTPLISSPGALTIVSTSAADATGGAGTQTARLYGIHTPTGDLDDAVRRVEDVPLNGVTPVPVPGDSGWFRVYRIRSVAGAANAGRLDAAIGGVVCASVDVGIGSSEMAFWSTITRTTILSWGASILKASGVSPAIIVKTWWRPWGGPARVFMEPIALAGSVDRDIKIYDTDGPTVAGRGDIYCTVFDFSGTSIDVLAGFRALH